MGLPGIAAMLFLLGITARALWPYRHLATDLRPWAYALAATTMCLGVFLKNMTDDFFVDHNALLFWTLVGGVLGTLTEQRANTKVQTQ
jgi:O-antigen ligase